MPSQTFVCPLPDVKFACPVIIEEVSGSESEGVWNIVGGRKKKKLRRPGVKVGYHRDEGEPDSSDRSAHVRDPPGERKVKCSIM